MASSTVSSKDKEMQEIIHKAKNHLAVIFAYIQLLEKAFPEESEEYRWTAKANEECKGLIKCLEQIDDIIYH